MTRVHDAVVVGAGPAGSVAALCLARAGADVVLVDKATFPRDKACGDVVGPRGVRLLADLGLQVPTAGRGSDMLVAGPGGRRLRLPAFPGRGYADHGLVAPRRGLDASLRAAAVAAGARPLTARVVGLCADGVVTADGAVVRARAVVGADGALSAVGRLSGLLDEGRALWGFAVRAYVPAEVPLPLIALWDESPGRVFPGYGWLFPGADGAANVGVGAGFGPVRRRLDWAGLLAAFTAGLRRSGDLDHDARPGRASGGWLRMGLVGAAPGRGRVLLVGDAAGLVNPLQGEGIAAAMTSGLLAAEAVVACPADPAAHYRAAVEARFGRYLAVAAPLHAGLLRHRRLVSTATRWLTAPPLGRLVAGTWSLLWNDLVDGATPRPAQAAAAAVTAAVHPLTARSATGRRLRQDVGAAPGVRPGTPARRAP